MPRALPDPAWPDVSGDDFVALLPMAFGVLILSTEAVGVSRALAAQHHYEVDTSRDLAAMGASNVLAGLSSGFVQSGGASQTAAADNAGGRTQLTALVAAALILLTGAFLGPLFTDLPQTALAAIVIVAVSSFLDVRGAAAARGAAAERDRAGGASRASPACSCSACCEGLIVTAAVSLAIVVKRLSRPARDGARRRRHARTRRCSTPTPTPCARSCARQPADRSCSTSSTATTSTSRASTCSPSWEVPAHQRPPARARRCSSGPGVSRERVRSRPP